MTRVARSILFGLLIIGIHVSARSADVSKKVYVDIDTQPLAKALAQWNQATDLSIYYAPDVDIETATAPEVKGVFLPADSLSRLIKPAGLYAEQVSPTLFAIKVGPPARNDSSRQRQPTAEPKQPEVNASSLSEVEVTGSRIRDARPDYLPLFSDSLDDINRSGMFTTDELSNLFPSNFSRINAQTTAGIGTSFLAANNVVHGAANDSFGLGPGATLALLDGRRLPLSGHDGSFADISMIPLSALDHVDVVTDAASAIYGGDAIAGVVNYVLKRRFVGLESTVYYGVTTGGGGREAEVSQLAGNAWSSGDVFFSYENYHQQAIDAASRDNLVPGPGPYQVIPEQARQSALLTFHKDFTPGVGISQESFYSSRDFSQEYTAFPFVDTHSVGNTRTFGSAVTGSAHLPADWLSTLDLGFSGEKERGATTAMGIQQPFDTHSNYYTVELRGEGPLVSVPGGPIRLSTGFSWRLETFNDFFAPLGPTGSGLERDVWGVDGEIFAPLVAKPNDVLWVDRLELSIAVRWDEYENRDAGLLNAHAVNPKFGILWSPGANIALRGTYTPSAFRAAPLAQLGVTNPALLAAFSNPNPQAAPINALYLTGGNNALHPERATTYTVGLDWKPDPHSGWSFSTSYFHTHYQERIATPPIGSLAEAFSQLATLSPYINSSPSAAEIQQIYDRYGVVDRTNIGQAAVQAILDGRYQNTASLHAAGVEATGTGEIPVPAGHVKFRIEAHYLTQLANQATQTVPYVAIAGTVFNPPTGRLRSEVWWTFHNWTTDVSADYTTPFRDTMVPGGAHVASWFILNARVSKEFRTLAILSPEGKTTVSLGAYNLANRDPPRIASSGTRSLNYDASNASPVGCEIRFEVRQLW